MVVANRIAKESPVNLLGLEPLGTERIQIRISDPLIGNVQSALDSAELHGEALRGRVMVKLLGAVSEDLMSLNAAPNSINGLYGGREELTLYDYKPNQKTMSNNTNALGILETQGLTAALKATDAMLKSAQVSLVGKEKIGAAYVTIIIRGDVAAVEAALRAGSEAVGDLGKLIAAELIARPHEDMLALLPAMVGQPLASANSK